MRTERIAEALERFVLRPGEELTDVHGWPDAVTVGMNRGEFVVWPAQWLIARESWVDEVVVAVYDPLIDDGFALSYGLLFGTDGTVQFLNDVATLGELGRRLATGLDPLAFAEILAELYSVANLDRPVVRPLALGYLIQDPAQFATAHPYVDGAVLARVSAPVHRRLDGGIELEFCSYVSYRLELAMAVDVLSWRVSAPSGQRPTWARTYLAERVPVPFVP
jgi:hypothetical protein